MRKLSIEKMEVKKDVKKVEAVVGASFEQAEGLEEVFNSRINDVAPKSIGGWSRIICFF